MTASGEDLFKKRGGTMEIEQGADFMPKFDTDGLIGAIVTERKGGAVLMFAYMNALALSETLKTGYAHFWSRSRDRLWKKGEESGNLLRVIEMRTDCDQDILWVIVDVEGDGVACHTGSKSCFYRRLADPSGGKMLRLEHIAPPKP